MARKNLLANLTENNPQSADAVGSISNREGPSPAFSSRGAFGAVTRTIDDLAARADAARALEARLAAGEVIIDLDPVLVDRSFVSDRMEQLDERYAQLKASIAEKGQDSPILVRPHPELKNRYQVAFGHRRLRAAAELGRPVRAIVRNLSDRELVVAQGQENSARADLSFIERARFAQALEDAGYDRETIMQALATDKTGLSRLIAVVNRLPKTLVEAIGPAPAAGRDRWLDLCKAYAEQAVARPVESLVQSSEFAAFSSDRRFEMVFLHLTKSERRSAIAKPRPRDWICRDGRKVASVIVTDDNFTIAIDRAVAKDFGEFLLARLDLLHEEYEREPSGN
jgi:ParB family chromosome partitioning protein